MTTGKKFYQLSAEGRSLWSRRERIRLPLDYRRILGLVEYDGHREVIVSHLARYPAQTVDGWLAEFEALRLIEAVALPDEKTLPELAQEKSSPPVEVEDRERIEPESTFADLSLTQLGVYVNFERIAHRTPTRKAPADTVALVVEDDPDQLALAVLRLTAAGYPVKTADGVRAMIESLEAALPDAVFLDVVLADGNGFDVLAALRRHPRCAQLPVIMVTAEAEPEVVARGLELGCDGYITKPYGRNTLDYVLRCVMKQEIALGAENFRAQSSLAETPH
jgi:CheY-like chemotaxis protein